MGRIKWHRKFRGRRAFRPGVGDVAARRLLIESLEPRNLMAVVDDTYSTRASDLLEVSAPGVLANDTDVALLDYVDPTSVKGATLTFESDGRFTYDPTGVALFKALNPGESVEDTFTYLAYGPNEEEWVGTVRITVEGPDPVVLSNRPPFAMFDVVTHERRDALTVAAPGLLANDSDPDAGDVLTVADFDQKSLFGADIAVNADGGYTYTPTDAMINNLLPGSKISDSFTYTIQDLDGLTSTSTVHLEYTESIALPVIFYGTNANTPIDVDTVNGLTGHRPDPNAPAVTLVRADSTSAMGGTLQVNADGSFRYDPTGVSAFRELKVGEYVEDSFNYTVTDGTLTGSSIIAILVLGQPDDDEDFFEATAERATDFAAPGLLANDTGTALQITQFDATSAKGATISVRPDGGFRYDPSTSSLQTFLKPGEHELDQFTYTTQDSQGNSKSITVSVRVAGFDHPFVSVSDDYSTDNQTILRVAAPGLLGNDYDVDHFGETTAPTLQVFDGRVNRPGDTNRDGVFDSADLIEALIAGEYEDLIADNSIWEEGDWNNDGEFDSNDLILGFAIGGYEDPNAPLPDLSTVDLSGDGKIDDIDKMLANQDLTSLKGAKIDVRSDGSFVYDPSTSAELMALAEGDFAIDEFVYTLTDASGRTQHSYVRVSVAGRVKNPVAATDLYEVTDGQTFGLQFGYNVLKNDRSFADDSLLMISSFESTSRRGATVSIDQDGTFNYDSSFAPDFVSLDPGESLSDEFAYTIEDANGRTSTATVKLTVFGVSEAPDDLFTAGSNAVHEVAAPGVLANDNLYIVNAALTKVTGFDATSVNGAKISLKPDGGFSYDPRGVAVIAGLAVGEVLYDSFTYTTHPSGTGEQHRVNIVVSPLQSATPVLTALPARRAPLAAAPLGRQSAMKLSERPEYGNRGIEEFYAGLPEVFNTSGNAPTSRYEYEFVDFRGTTMLKIYLVNPVGGDNKLWRLHDDKLVEQIFVRNGKGTAVLYTAEHDLPTSQPYQSVWLVGFDRAPNRFIDIYNSKPLVIGTGNQNDHIELKNYKGSAPLPGEDFIVRIETGEGDDSVLGSHLRDKIELGAGNDTVSARGGSDEVFGGPGKDTIDGNEDRNLCDPGPAGDGDSISNCTVNLPVPSLDVIQRKLKPEELGKTKVEETVWFDDALPPGARFVDWRDHRSPVEITKANGEVQSGDKAFQVNASAGARGFQFDDANPKLTFENGSKLFTYVYLDPTNPPSRIALNYRVGGNWNNGAYWGPEPTLKAGQELKQGESLWSADGSLQLTLQTDGNLVLYNQAQGGSLWASNTNGRGADRAVMQGDGNFVIYAGGSAIWSTNTSGNNATLAIQQDGNLVVVGNDGSVKWASGSNRVGAGNILLTNRIDDLPKAGEWVKLEIDPAMIGLKPGTEINGMFFKAIGGKATWDKAGVSRTKDKDEATMSVKLTGDVLSILGRENYGFQIRGDWTVTDNFGAETFTAAGRMTLVSKIGEIPFVGPPISILTKSDSQIGFGVVNQPTISFAGMDLKTGVIGALNDLLDKIGLNLTLSGMQFGVATGKTLKDNLLKSVGAPLNDMIPYLFFSSFNAPQVSYGEIGIGVDNTAGMAVIFDPADPFMYISGMDPRGDVLAVGISKNGYIPFDPLRDLDERIGDDLYGNLYARGKILIPIKAIDLGLDGELTLDTDLNDDGVGFLDRFEKGFFASLIKGLPGKEADALVEGIKDMGIGLNGKVTVGLGKKGIGIEIPVGTASLLVKGDGRAAFNGGTVNPWEGTFLERFNTIGEVQVDGFISGDAFVVNAKMASSKFGPIQTAGTIKITNRDISVSLETRSPIPTFPNLAIKGNITFAGDFKLYAESRKGVDFGPFGAEMYMGIGFSKMGSTYQIDTAFGAGIRMNVLICKDLELNFKASGLIGFGEVFEFSFRGNFRIFCQTPWYVPGPSIGPFDLGFGVDNRGLTLPLPGPLPNLRVNF